MTRYVVLERGQDGGFREIKQEEASTDQGAIRKALAGATQAQRDYVAVPLRSWRIREVEAETKTEITIR